MKCENCGNEIIIQVNKDYKLCARCIPTQSKLEPDDLLPFREAARLGCKDFHAIQGKVYFIQPYDKSEFDLNEADTRYTHYKWWPDINRQAAACCFWFWKHYSNKNQSAYSRILTRDEMTEKIEEWAAKHCAPEKKASNIPELVVCVKCGARSAPCEGDYILKQITCVDCKAKENLPSNQIKALHERLSNIEKLVGMKATPPNPRHERGKRQLAAIIGSLDSQCELSARLLDVLRAIE